MSDADTQLEGRVALVTGAASGIGFETARELIDAGAHVHAVGRRRDVLEERLRPLDRDGALACHEADVTDEDAVRRLVAEIGERSPIEALVCAAGTNVPARRLELLTPENWHRLIETNLTAVFTFVHAALDQLRATRGHAVVVSSVSGAWPDVSGPAYQASKAGVLAFVRAVALEEHARGVRFTTIMPGVVDTPLLDKRPQPPNEEARQLALQPEDVATTIVCALRLPVRACLAELTIVPTILQAVGATQ